MRPGRAAEHSHPSSAAVMEEYSYTSTHPLGHTGAVTGSLYFYIYPLNRRLGRLQSRSGSFGGEKNLLPMPGFESQIDQPVA